MSADSPAEYIAQLREENRALRAALVAMCHEKRVLLEYLAQQNARMLETRRRAGIAPHDYEPARPGISEID